MMKSEIELIGAAQRDLLHQREQLLQTFPATDALVASVRGAMADLGLRGETDIINIPYTLDALDQATAITSTGDFVSWTVLHALADEREMHPDIVGDFEEPGAFYLHIWDAVVVLDSRDYGTETYGPGYAASNYLDCVAHELTHSGFRATYRSDFTADSEAGMVAFTFGALGPPPARYIVNKDFPQPDVQYGAVWVDEAFAVHTAAQVRMRLDPNVLRTSEEFPTRLEFYGAVPALVPAHYITAAGHDSYLPVPDCLAGMGLEALESESPGIIGDLHSLAHGRRSLADFHTSLYNRVGADLYTLLATEQPYSTWRNIYAAIAGS